MICCAAGDPGGSRAVLASMLELERRGIACAVPEHGFLGREMPEHLRHRLFPEEEAVSRLPACKALLFGSSSTDIFPLLLARQARACRIPVVHVLDNWGGYVERLRMDGHDPLFPDCYAVMDESAAQEALEEGVPSSTLRVTGHPGLAACAEDLRHIAGQDQKEQARRFGLPEDKHIVAFVNEPFSAVLGADVTAPGHPGFTEDVVLAAFARALAPHAGDAYVLVLPHPKDSVASVSALWHSVRGTVSGEVLRLPFGRDAFGVIRAVAGMASLALYEAWLSGLPMLAIQPECRLSSLRRIGLLAGAHYARTWEEIVPACEAWFAQSAQTHWRAPRPELDVHAAAPAAVADAVLSLIQGRA